ncbi:MAG: hypothetical protein PHX54_11775 [Lentimicrobiaceae bacterium]|nr:hypothetical protein [Lentimicrobiaceae bacterium]
MASFKSRVLKPVWYYIKVFAWLILFFLGFAVLSSLVPDKPVRSNIEYSLTFMENQPSYPHMIIEGMNHRPDYAMDGLMTNIIYTIDNHDVIKSALLGRGRIDYTSPYVSQWKWVKYNTLNNKQNPNFFYARYWHGNSYFFRLFYAFTNYNEIKWIIFMITSLLMAFFAIKLGRELGALKALLLLSGLFFMNVYVMQFSMQLSPVLIISVVMSLVLIRWMHRGKNPAVLFFISGALATYFDLLTAPLLTLGIPMLLWVSMCGHENNLKTELWHGFKQLVGFSLLWIVAYSGAWAMKMIITIPFSELDIVSDVTNQFLRRAGSENITRMDAIMRNFNLIPLVFVNILLLVPVLLSPFFFNKQGIAKFVLFLAVAFLPYIWFYGAADHSYGHYWYTYRIQAITISGVLLAVYSLVDWHRVKLQWRRLFRKKPEMSF